MVSALILIGAPGSGKSSVLEELATLHDIEAIEHGAIEAESLSLGRPLLPSSSWIPQLDAVLALQREAGRRRFLISTTGTTAEDLAAVMNAAIQRDKRGFICTGSQVSRSRWHLEREPMLLETSVPGVFAAGDARSQSIKRVASGVGEGSMAIAFVHEHLSAT